jgi:hypothetical protein
MSTIRAEFEEMAGHAKEYVNVKVDILKLKAAEKSSAVLSAVLSFLVVAFIFTIFLVFISIALAYVTAAWLGSMALGFLCVGGLYFLIGIFIWLSREKLIRLPIMNQIIAELFKDAEHEEKL